MSVSKCNRYPEIWYTHLGILDIWEFDSLLIQAGNIKRVISFNIIHIIPNLINVSQKFQNGLENIKVPVRFLENTDQYKKSFLRGKTSVLSQRLVL